MIPTFQTVIDKEVGNCFSACVASILEMKIEDIPDFWEYDEKESSFWHKFHEFLKPLGLSYVIIKTIPDEKYYSGINTHIWQTFPHLLENQHVICSVLSQKYEGTTHAVVGKFDFNFLKVVHDPNPNNERKYNTKDILSFGFFLKDTSSK